VRDRHLKFHEDRDNLQVGLTEVKGPESYQLYHAPVAWPLAELAVLNRYRERAQ
jgi:hypothetical protein